MRTNLESTRPPDPSPRWLSPAEVARRLGVSRSQVSRLAAKHVWKRLDVSTGEIGRNQGVRYALTSIEQFEQSFST